MKILPISSRSCNNGPVSPNKNNENRKMPSFGAYILDDLFYMGLRKYNSSRANFRYDQITDVRKKVQDVVSTAAKRFNADSKQILERYKQYLETDKLQPVLNGEENGLNKLVGRSYEKLELIKNVVVPILNRDKGAENAVVPNGIIFYGPEHSGKTFTARCLMEHLKQQIGGLKIVELGKKSGENDIYRYDKYKIGVDWKTGDTNENLEAFWSVFDVQRKSNRYYGHTMVLINEMDNILNNKNADLLKTELMFQTQNCAKDGITWIGTVKDKNSIPEWLLDDSRTNILMEIGELNSDVEASLALSHFIAENKRTDKTKHEVILDLIRARKIPMTPVHIKNIIEGACKRAAKNDFWSEGGSYRASVTTENMKNEIEAYSRKIAEEGPKENIFDDNAFINRG